MCLCLGMLHAKEKQVTRSWFIRKGLIKGEHDKTGVIYEEGVQESITEVFSRGLGRYMFDRIGWHDDDQSGGWSAETGGWEHGGSLHSRSSG